VQGYKIALWLDSEAECKAWGDNYHDYGEGQRVDFMRHDRAQGYPGYSQAANNLIRMVAMHDKSADWFVCGGDDVFPDPNHTAAEIAAQCSEHFKDLAWPRVGVETQATRGPKEAPANLRSDAAHWRSLGRWTPGACNVARCASDD
jgi:hypothetical protein